MILSPLTKCVTKHRTSLSNTMAALVDVVTLDDAFRNREPYKATALSDMTDDVTNSTKPNQLLRAEALELGGRSCVSGGVSGLNQ